MTVDPEEVAHCRSRLLELSKIVFFTGAGMSAESGVPTFRGPGGLWQGHRPEELATPGAFARDPEKVTDWYRWRRSIVAAVALHPGHEAVAGLCRSRPETRVVTQNVDGLHQRSGCPSVVELHGSLWVDRCVLCAAERPIAAEAELLQPGEPLERCRCGGTLRPGVVWFGEALPAMAWETAIQTIRDADAIVVVGTSAVVQPAASLIDAAPPGAFKVEVNPEPVLETGVRIAGPAAEWLPVLLAEPDRAGGHTPRVI